MINLHWLENSLFQFPDPETAMKDPDGLLCASMKLDAETVISAYKQGVFPWYSEGQPVLWWSPDPRCVVFPERFHVSRSLRRTLNKQAFEIRMNTAFDSVMIACAAPRPKYEKTENSGTWITQAMFDVYCELHDRGYAHSVECWQGSHLVGGVYGVILGDIFFGESMFSRATDASKVALHHICTELKPFLLDAQVYSDHLATLGAENISRRQFIDIVSQRLDKTLTIEPSQPGSS